MGSRLVYYLIIVPVSLLPHWLLYRLSDLTFLVIFYLVRYRRKVVRTNLKRSFPDKDPAFISTSEREFYRHFCDLIVESLKGFNISPRQVKKRFVLNNPEVADQYFSSGKSVVLVGGHYNNWEMLAQGAGYGMKHLPIGIYKPLHNKFFDSKMKRSRERGRLFMVPTSAVRETFETSEYGEPISIIFGIDQSPSDTRRCHWMNFLNQDTAVPFGAEKYAREYEWPVLFGRINKVKRGHYSFDLTVVAEHPNAEEYASIIERSTQLLEKDIQDEPQYWLWSHRRWKKKRPSDLVFQPDADRPKESPQTT